MTSENSIVLRRCIDLCLIEYAEGSWRWTMMPFAIFVTAIVALPSSKENADFHNFPSQEARQDKKRHIITPVYLAIFASAVDIAQFYSADPGRRGCSCAIPSEMG